jgi:hypothetical protein
VAAALGRVLLRRLGHHRRQPGLHRPLRRTPVRLRRAQRPSAVGLPDRRRGQRRADDLPVRRPRVPGLLRGRQPACRRRRCRPRPRCSPAARHRRARCRFRCPAPPPARASRRG